MAFHFRSDADTERHFLNQGFDALSVHDPADFYTTLPIPRTRGTPMVRVLEASVS